MTRIALGFPVLTPEGRLLPIWLARRTRRAGEGRFSCRIATGGDAGPGPVSALQDDVFSGHDGGLHEARWQALDLQAQHLEFVFESEDDRRAVLRGPWAAGWLAIGGYSASLAIDLACGARTDPPEPDEAGTGLLVSVQRSIDGELLGLGADAQAKTVAVLQDAGTRRLALLLLATDVDEPSPQHATVMAAGPGLCTQLASSPDNLVLTLDAGDSITRAHELLGWLGWGASTPASASALREPAGPTFADLWTAALPNHASLRERIAQRGTQPADTPLFEIQALALAQRGRVFAGHADAGAPDNLLIAGPTGCGKTALGEALCLNAIFERHGVVLYLAPTRALAYEFHRRFLDRHGELLGVDDPSQRLVVSTGERGEADLSIRLGHVDLASIVTEKANVLMGLRDSRLLRRLSLVLVDELHMLADPARGGVVDLLVTKLLEEQQRREADEPLQIVGLSTEGLNEPIARWWSQLWDRPTLQLGAQRRPLGVRHRVIVHGLKPEAGHGGWLDHELMTFEGEGQRRLLPRSRAHADLVTALTNRFAGQPVAKTADNRWFADCIERQWQRGCRTVLFAYGSKEALRRVARQLKNRRSRGGSGAVMPAAPSVAALAELRSILDQTDETSATTRERQTWAEHGIVVHDGDTPASVRAWIERTFSQPRAADWADWPVVVLCTETLTYGVNLCVDVVVLGGLEFPRESGELQKLDANQFHNLLGRVGRPGLTASREEIDRPEPLAIVCFRADAGLGHAHWQDFVKRYYTRDGQPEAALSALFSPSELADVRRRAQQRGHPRLKALARAPKLEQVRPATFRAVVDVMHHLGGVDSEVELDDIVAFVARTIHHGTCHDDDIDAVPGLLEEVLEAAVEFSESAPSRGVPALVERGGATAATPHHAGRRPRYRLRAAAKALIDTGTQITAIKPIAGWLGGLRQASPDGPLAPELMLPGLVLTPEFWNTAKNACSEGNETRELAHAYEGASQARARQLLRGEFDRLDRPGLDWDALDRLLQAHLRDHGHGVEHASNEAFKLSILMKLTAMAWAWLRGAPVDEIVAMYDKVGHESESEQRPSSFHARLAERLSWLAQMTHRFFGEASDWLPAGFERDLPDLSRRLRLGLPPAGLPMLGVRARLDRGRQKIAAWLALGIRPRQFLMPHDGGATLSPSDAQMLRRRVRRSYRTSLDQLQQALFDGDPAGARPGLVRALAAVRELLANDPRAAAWVSVSTQGIGALVEAALEDLLGHVHDPQAKVHAQALAIVLGPRRLVWRGATSGRADPATDTRHDGRHVASTCLIRVHEPWPLSMTPPAASAASNITHMTATGALCATSLAARGLLSWPRFFDLAEARNGTLLNLRDLVSHAHTPAMKQTGALFDALLLWDEPGVL